MRANYYKFTILVYFPELLSCVRHLSVRSIVSRVPVESQTHLEEEQVMECDEKDCHECKQRKRLALVDKLPQAVGSGEI